MKAIFSILILSASLTACGHGFTSAGSSDSNAPLAVSADPFPNHHFVFGALGDSISRGFDISFLGAEDLSMSWTTGDALSASHINSFRNIFTQNGWSVTSDVHNLAVSGGTALGSGSALAANATLLASYAPDYVTVEIGANDVCNALVATPAAVAAFQTKIESVLMTLVTAPRPPKVIALLSVPHIFALTQIPELAGNSSCQTVWNFVCPNLAIGQVAFEAQWTAVNQALANAANAVGGPVIYDNGAISTTTFSLSDVSQVDCFHPSQSGQAKIATSIWQLVESAVNQKIINVQSE